MPPKEVLWFRTPGSVTVGPSQHSLGPLTWWEGDSAKLRPTHRSQRLVLKRGTRAGDLGGGPSRDTTWPGTQGATEGGEPRARRRRQRPLPGSIHSHAPLACWAPCSPLRGPSTSSRDDPKASPPHSLVQVRHQLGPPIPARRLSWKATEAPQVCTAPGPEALLFLLPSSPDQCPEPRELKARCPRASPRSTVLPAGPHRHQTPGLHPDSTSTPRNSHRSPDLHWPVPTPTTHPARHTT